MKMRKIKEILENVKSVVGASSARPSAKARLNKKTILIIVPILILLIAALIAVGITIAAGNTTEPETEQTFTEEGDGYYIWVRAVDHAGNKGPWSEAQRVWIETGKPTITLKSNSNTTWARTGSVTVALQDSKSGLASGAKLKYGWSTSNSTAPSNYTDVTPSYTDGTTSEVTFTASASGLTGKYYLWVVPTTLADKTGNTQTETVKSTGTFYFDNNKPTAGTATMKLGSSSGSAYSNNSWTNQSVYVAKNNGSDGSGESGHSSTTWTIAGTAESGTSKTLDPGSGKSATYSIVVTTADVAGNTASNTYTVRIDKVGPTAPTISGGSTSWATSRTIKVDTDSTDTGVGTIANYEYYCGSSAPTASTGATGSLSAGTTSKVFNTNYNGYYVSFRAVDGVGNKGTWSSTQRLYVDTVSPTVKVNNATLEITQGDSNTFDSLFTVTWGGITTGTTAYTLNDASTSYTNTNELAAGTYTLKCTANKNNGTSANASVTITVSSLPSSDTLLVSHAGSHMPTGFTIPAEVTMIKLVWNEGSR